MNQGTDLQYGERPDRPDQAAGCSAAYRGPTLPASIRRGNPGRHPAHLPEDIRCHRLHIRRPWLNSMLISPSHIQKKMALLCEHCIRLHCGVSRASSCQWPPTGRIHVRGRRPSYRSPSMIHHRFHSWNNVGKKARHVTIYTLTHLHTHRVAHTMAIFATKLWNVSRFVQSQDPVSVSVLIFRFFFSFSSSFPINQERIEFHCAEN